MEKKTASTMSRPVLDKDMDVLVRNGFAGRLIFKAQNGHTTIWNEFGDENWLTVAELREAVNSQPKFYRENWFIIDDPEVIQGLRVEQYYKDALSIEEFDSIFSLPQTKMIKRIKALSDGQRRSLTYRASALIKSGKIDSRATISALEKELKVEFED